MLHRHQQTSTLLHKILDALIIGLSFWLAYSMRAHSIGVTIFHYPLEDFSEYAWLLAFVLPVTPLILEMQGLYNRHLLGSRLSIAWQYLKGTTLITIGAILVQFFFREQLARTVYIFFPLIGVLLLLFKEEIVRGYAVSRVGKNRLRKKLIVAGNAEDRQEIESYLAQRGRTPFDIVRTIPLDEQVVADLPDLLHEHSVNGVVMCAQHTAFGVVEKAIQICELEGVEIWLMADFFTTQISQTGLDNFYGKPMLVFRPAPVPSWQLIAKQCLDFFGALGFLLLATIPMLIIALLIKCSSKGPILFRQQRAGLNGEPFQMLKFRSMVSNAEQLKAELEQLNEMTGPVFKVTDDPRITRVGRFLRKWSLDELPQLFNILCGHMSLVGPRPLPIEEVGRFDDRAHRRRLSVKPGLTCLWQVAGRSDLKDFKEWVRLDLEYIDNWSIWLDLKILLRTIPVVLSGAGAK